MTKINLPFPPSTNSLFSNVGKRRVRSKRYAVWARHAENELLAQRAKPIQGDVSIAIKAGRPDGRKRDLDNLLKAPLDLLVSCGIIEDDSRIIKIAIEWADVDGLVLKVKKRG